MILWPAGAALVVVWSVFRDPTIDYRVVVLGALVPDLVDFSGAGVAHALVGSVTVLTAVMLLTRRARAARRRWLALPIGMFIHLVVDGAWASSQTFWWPFLGLDLDGPLPALDRPLPIALALELAGAVALAWFWVRFGLGEHQVRRNLLATGRLPTGRAR